VVLASAVVLALLVLPAPAALASIWTQLSTGTSESIASLAYPAREDIVFVTTDGNAFYETSSGFAEGTGIGPGTSLASVAIAPNAAAYGVAVGKQGAVYSTADGGHTWSAPALPAKVQTAECGEPPKEAPLGTIDLSSVRFAHPNTFYIVGDDGIVLKSTDFGASFNEVDKGVSGEETTCVIPYHGQFLDSAWASAEVGFLISSYFGQAFESTDGLANAGGTVELAEATSGFEQVAAIALDAASPNLLWTVDSGESGGSYERYSTDGGSSWLDPIFYNAEGDGIGQPAGPQLSVADAEGTTLMVGDDGTIYNSTNGVDFYERPIAPGDTSEWRAVSLMDPADAAVGGVGGKLLVTNQANAGPIAPSPATPIVSPPVVSTPVVSTPTSPPAAPQPVATPVHSESSFLSGPDVVRLLTPADCVRAGVVTARLAVAPRKRKGKVVLKVGKVIFKVDDNLTKVRTKAPFAETFHLRLLPGSTHTFSAQVFIRVHHAPPRHKTLRNTFKACA
jgi:photosystem II stability/assembly factor-like uncharacterized protein